MTTTITLAVISFLLSCWAVHLNVKAERKTNKFLEDLNNRLSNARKQSIDEQYAAMQAKEQSTVKAYIKEINLSVYSNPNMLHKLQEVYTQNNKPSTMYIGQDVMDELGNSLSGLGFKHGDNTLVGTHCILKVNTSLNNTGKAII